MVNVALPSIMRSFGTTLTQTEWVAVMYLLTITVTLLVWGRFADRCGLERIYLLGMLIFTVGSVACYLAPTLILLVLCRFIQASGASMMMSSGPAILKKVFPVGQLGRILGLIGIATSIGLMAGPMVSGLMIRYYSWRALFLITVPVSLVCVVLGMWSMKREPLPVKERTPLHFSWLGFSLWTAVITLFVLLSTHHAHLSFLLVGSGVGVLFFLAVGFILVERRVAEPLLPFSLLRKRQYAIAMLCAAISFAVLFMALILLPFYLDYVLQLPVDRIGLVMMAVPLAVLLVSPIAGRLHDHIGAKYLTTSGLSLCCLAMFLLCFLDESSRELAVIWRMALLGAGQALFLSPNSASVLVTVEHRYVGVTSGMLATSRNLGMLIGVTLAGLVFSAAFSSFSGGHELLHFNPEQTGIFLRALRISYGLAVALGLIGVLLSAVRQSKDGSFQP